jgi:hypothetical protein
VVLGVPEWCTMGYYSIVGPPLWRPCVALEKAWSGMHAPVLSGVK